MPYFPLEQFAFLVYFLKILNFLFFYFILLFSFRFRLFSSFFTIVLSLFLSTTSLVPSNFANVIFIPFDRTGSLARGRY